MPKESLLSILLYDHIIIIAVAEAEQLASIVQSHLGNSIALGRLGGMDWPGAAHDGPTPTAAATTSQLASIGGRKFSILLAGINYRTTLNTETRRSRGFVVARNKLFMPICMGQSVRQAGSEWDGYEDIRIVEFMFWVYSLEWSKRSEWDSNDDDHDRQINNVGLYCSVDDDYDDDMGLLREVCKRASLLHRGYGHTDGSSSSGDLFCQFTFGGVTRFHGNFIDTFIIVTSPVLSDR